MYHAISNHVTFAPMCGGVSGTTCAPFYDVTDDRMRSFESRMVAFTHTVDASDTFGRPMTNSRVQHTHLWAESSSLGTESFLFNVRVARTVAGALAPCFQSTLTSYVCEQAFNHGWFKNDTEHGRLKNIKDIPVRSKHIQRGTLGADRIVEVNLGELIKRRRFKHLLASSLNLGTL